MDYKEKAKEIMCILPTIKHTHHGKCLEKISKGEFNILRRLGENQGKMMSKDIASANHISTARVATAIKSLEEKGYVSRQEVEGDRRKTMVCITSQGSEILEAMYQEALQHMAEFLEYAGPEDTENLIRIIKKVKGFNEQ